MLEDIEQRNPSKIRDMLEVTEEVQRPIVPKEEEWYRKEFFKNWGKLKPLNFRRGKPMLLLPPYSRVLRIGFLLLIVNFISEFSLLTFVLTLLSACIFLYACHLQPGIQSHELPILNETTYMRMKNYCSPCRIFIKPDVVHCPDCRVCIGSQVSHSELLGMCVTSKNLYIFCLLFCLWLAAILASFSCLIK